MMYNKYEIDKYIIKNIDIENIFFEINTKLNR